MKSQQLKLLYKISFLLLALELVMVLAALPFLPDSIPAHYNAAGVADRWGSKYEALIFPLLLLPYGGIWMGVSRLTRGSSSGEMAEFLLLIGGVVQFAVFDVMTACFLYADFRQTERLASLPVDLNRILCAVTGLGLIALGNYLPKLKTPGPVGLRTRWSMKNEAVWRRCQRFGGWSLAAAGVFSIAAALIAGGWQCWLWMTLALVAAGAAGTVYSRRAAMTAPEQ